LVGAVQTVGEGEEDEEEGGGKEMGTKEKRRIKVEIATKKSDQRVIQ
jgi:hypothetical protein